jgi:O-glycosyl hydrolase
MMNFPRLLMALATVAGMAALGLLSVPRAYSQSISIEVTTTKQQKFQGFGAAISNTIGDFLPSGGRADKAGSTAAAIYNLLLTPSSHNSLNLTYLRLSLNADQYQKSAGSAYDFASSVIKTGQADVIKAAKSRNPKIKIYYSNWTPPFWMKENGADYDVNIGTTTDPVTFSVDAKTTNHLLASQQGNYAALLGQFCTDFNAYFKFPVDALSFQNEPDVNVSYGSCLYPSNSGVDSKAATYATTLTALRQVPPFSSWTLPQVWGPECTSAKNTDYIAAVTGLGLLNAVSTHSYGSGVGDLPAYDRNNLPVHMTEYSLTDSGPYASKVNGVVSQPQMAAQMADQFCKDVNDGQSASWFWWSCLGTDVAGVSKANTGECLIIANRVYNPNSVYTYVDQSGFPADHALIALNDNTKYPATGGPYETPYKSEFGTDWTLTSKYYAFRRLTQSVLPGSISLLTKTSPSYTSASHQDDVYSAAFRLPSGKCCVIIANQSGTTHTVNLKVDGLTPTPYTGLTAYYTAAGSNDVSWHDTLTHGAMTTTAWPYSVTCYVPQ